MVLLARLNPEFLMVKSRNMLDLEFRIKSYFQSFWLGIDGNRAASTITPFIRPGKGRPADGRHGAPCLVCATWLAGVVVQLTCMRAHSLWQREAMSACSHVAGTITLQGQLSFSRKLYAGREGPYPPPSCKSFAREWDRLVANRQLRVHTQT
jgi:hypothetical protein